MAEPAFTRQLKPGTAAEYRRHAAIRPELAAARRTASIRDYSIFLDKAPDRLFGVQKRLPGHRADALPALPLIPRWWACMADSMDANLDPAPQLQLRRRVFHADQGRPGKIPDSRRVRDGAGGGRAQFGPVGLVWPVARAPLRWAAAASPVAPRAPARHLPARTTPCQT